MGNDFKESLRQAFVVMKNEIKKYFSGKRMFVFLALMGIIVRMAEEPTPEVLEKIKALDNVGDAARNGGNECLVKIKGGVAEQEKLFNDIHTIGVRIFSLSEIENTLETIYLDLIKESR